MAVFKLSTLFQMASAISSPNFPLHRVAGWSETIYGNFSSQQALLAEAARGSSGVNIVAIGQVANPFPGLWAARAALLPTGALIVGARVQQVDVPGPVQTLALTIPGSSGLLADAPFNSLLVRAPGLGSNAIRRFTLRCIPDSMITEGEYQPTAPFAAALSQYFAELSQWAFRSKLPTGVKTKIVNVTAAGVLTTEAATTLAVGQMCKVTKTRDSGGNLRGGRFLINATGTPPPTLTLNNWTFGATTGGTVFLDPVVSYPNIDSANTAFSRIVSRRVGRPFVGYRGRRSRRR